MPNQTRIQMWFVTGDGATVNKIEVRDRKRVIITRVVDGVEEHLDIDCSSLIDGADGFEPPGGYATNSLHQFTPYLDGTAEFNIVSYYPTEADVPSIDFSKTVETYPSYAWLADGESETQETTLTTPTWLPTAAEQKATNIANWKARIGATADRFDISTIDVSDVSAAEYTNAHDHGRFWLGATWNEVEKAENEDSDVLGDDVINAMIATCESELEDGVKKWFYAASTDENKAAWTTKLAANELWTTGDDGAPDKDYRSANGLSAYTQSDFDLFIDTSYVKAQAYGVGVEL